MTVFILQNQHGQYLGKDGEWVDSEQACTLFRSPHHDVALNQLIEVNAKDHSLRGVVIACSLDSKGRPVTSEQQPLADSNAEPSTALVAESSQADTHTNSGLTTA